MWNVWLLIESVASAGPRCDRVPVAKCQNTPSPHFLLVDPAGPPYPSHTQLQSWNADTIGDVDMAFEFWNDIPNGGSMFSRETAPVPVRVLEPPGPGNQIWLVKTSAWTTDPTSGGLGQDTNVLGLTVSGFASGSFAWVHTDVYLNIDKLAPGTNPDDLDGFWYPGPNVPPASGWPIRGVIQHELGHALMFTEAWRDAVPYPMVMDPTVPVAGIDQWHSALHIPSGAHYGLAASAEEVAIVKNRYPQGSGEHDLVVIPY